MHALVVALSLAAEPIAEAPAVDHSRLEELTRHFDDNDTAANAWFWSWTAAYGALTVGQAIGFAVVNDRELRVNFAVGGISSLIGLVALMIPPFPAAFAKRRLAAVPAGDGEAAKLARAEELLSDSADAERFGRSWLIHAGCAAVSVAGGLVLWLGYGYLVDGIINTLVSVAVGELQIWTQPMAAARALPVAITPTLRGFAVSGVF